LVEIMLEHTFIHLPGIGQRTERRLWDGGIVRWVDALNAGCPEGFSRQRWSLSCRLLEQSMRCLERGDHRHFAASLHRAEHWRAWADFRDSVAYLDIETTGCSHYDSVTVVGIYDGVRSQSFIADDNLDRLPEVLAQYSMIVTFNGSSFDLPFLRRHFQGLKFNQLHLDLMHVLRRLGLGGGLKAIEHRLGLVRDSEIAHLDGWDAVRLWGEYRAGNKRSLDLLIRYNIADIENLEHLAEMAYRRLRASLCLPCDEGDIQ